MQSWRRGSAGKAFGDADGRVVGTVAVGGAAGSRSKVNADGLLKASVR